ncbi:sigma factor, partial [Nocardioides sp. NPDC000441]
MPDMDDLGEVMIERRRLIALAYRLLGTVEEAEDAVQETYLRWYRLSDDERAAIDNPSGWLSRVTSRVCLDVLKSARSRRERYVGPWLPEPVRPGFLAAPEDPADRATLDDTVSTALLVVLDAMTPAERVAFVLHDIFAVPFGDIAGVVGRSPAAVRQLA